MAVACVRASCVCGVHAKKVCNPTCVHLLLLFVRLSRTLYCEIDVILWPFIAHGESLFQDTFLASPLRRHLLMSSCFAYAFMERAVHTFVSVLHSSVSPVLAVNAVLSVCLSSMTSSSSPFALSRATDLEMCILRGWLCVWQRRRRRRRQSHTTLPCMCTHTRYTRAAAAAALAARADEGSLW